MEKFHMGIPISAENIQKIGPAIGVAARAVAPVLGRAGKTALDTGAKTFGAEMGTSLADKTKKKTGLNKQSPDVAARMWQRGLVWDGNKHRWVKRPEITHEDAPAEGKSYHNNVIVVPKDKSFWGSGATYGETEKASKILASMIEHKFPGSTVIFGKKPAIQGEHEIEIDKWIEHNWKKAVSRRRDRKEVFNKSDLGKYSSDKEIEQRKKNKKWWEEKNRQHLRELSNKK